MHNTLLMHVVLMHNTGGGPECVLRSRVPEFGSMITGHEER